MLVAVLSTGQVWAMEICNNGIDDDGDGYIDCYDSDCSGVSPCDSISYINLPTPMCQYTPTGVTFSMAEKWRTNGTAQPMDNRQTPMVGDIDGDGMPEVVARQANLANALYVFDGLTGVVERVIPSPATDIFNDAIALGDIDGDGFGEILMVTDAVASNRSLYCYEHTGALKWVSSVPVGYNANDERSIPQIADFDQDGQAEVYVGNQIFSGATGALLVSGGAGLSRGGFGAGNECFPIAADVLPPGLCANCAGLELVAGNVVYAVDLPSNTIQVVRDLSLTTTMTDGPTSIADIDLDGDLDAVVVANVGGSAFLYIWDLQTATLLAPAFQVDLVSASGANTTTAGGQPNIADFNNDGTPEIGLAGRHIYVVFDFNTTSNTIVELWSRVTQDNSERTGSSVFDFEGDGANEVVYRDETTLYVYDGATGAIKTSVPCIAATRYDYPVVVDVDNDDQTDIVCACGNQVIAYGASAVPWVKARPIWNQHGYLVVNINDDLSIPQVQQGHHLGWPQGAPTRYPFNAFLTQTTTLNTLGLPNYEAPDDSIGIADTLAHIDYSLCQDGANDSIGVRYTVYNQGDAAIPAGTPVSLYADDPFSLAGTYLTTIAIPTTIQPGGNLLLPWVYVADQGGMLNLWAVVNDDGTGGIPLTMPIFTHGECNFANNTHELNVVDCGNHAPDVVVGATSPDTVFFTVPEGGPYPLCFTVVDPDMDLVDVTGLLTIPGYGTVGGIGDGDTCLIFSTPVNTFGQSVFTIEVCDDANVPLCDTVVVVVDVFLVNEPPIAVNDPASTPEDVPVTVPILINDSDFDGDPLTPTLLSGPFNGTATLLPNGDVVYTPDPNFNGLDSVQYVVCDTGAPPLCDTAWVVINVNPVNDPPVAIDDTTIVPNDTSGVTIQVTNNDIDIEGDATVTAIVCGPNAGTATVSGNTVIYTPSPTFIGLDSFCYTYCDLTGCDTAVVYVTLTNGNLPPVATNDVASGTHFDPLTIGILGNDSDPDPDSIVISGITCGPTNGTVTIVGDSLLYQPNYGFIGQDTICYTVCDVPPSGPPFCDNAVVYITILPDNTPPVLQDDTASTTHADPVTVSVLNNDLDPDGDTLTVTAAGCGGPANGVVSVVNGTQVIYTPNPGFLGQDVFCYIVCDNGFPSLCDTAYVTVTVVSDNNPPMAFDDFPTIGHADPLYINPTLNDVDPDGDLMFVSAVGCGPSNGTLTLISGDSVLYQPNYGFLGQDTFCYVMCDNGVPSYCDTAYVYVDVIQDNTAPIAVDDADSLQQGTSSALTVTQNDVDLDGDSLTLTIIQSPGNGSALVNGYVVTYSPLPNFAGTDSIRYAICDDGFPPLCDTATVYYTIYFNDFGAPIGFSPNGDGDNETWVLDGLDAYPDHNLQIFNRWGKLVYESSNYQNDWDGTYQGKPLPEASYFWVIDPGDGTDLIKGYVVIFR